MFLGREGRFWETSTAARKLSRQISSSLIADVPNPCGNKFSQSAPYYIADDPSYSYSSSLPSYSGPAFPIVPNDPTKTCYVDLIIAIDLSCMNSDELAMQLPQTFVNGIIGRLVRAGVFSRDYHFRLELIGFHEQIIRAVSLSEFSFVQNRNPQFALDRVKAGLHKLYQNFESQNYETDFVKAIHDIAIDFDSRSYKHRELLLFTNAQHSKNLWAGGNGFWAESEKADLRQIISQELVGDLDRPVKVTAFAMNDPCVDTGNRWDYPEDCSFPDILRMLDPSFTSQQTLISYKSVDNTEQHMSLIASRYIIQEVSPQILLANLFLFFF